SFCILFLVIVICISLWLPLFLSSCVCFVYDQKTWTEALSYCREKYTDLATIEDMEDMKTLNDMAELSKMGAWIGLHTDLNRWRWSMSDRGFYNNGEAEFRNWSPGEPNNKENREHCTQMYNKGLWNDRDCDSKCKAVCSYVRGEDCN
uniref:C-type lectin domain-containing protein n=1 Tax=Amphilophus citrinellus TaxID=61819 RepID=A0A3Q0SUT2_AMPCI